MDAYATSSRTFLWVASANSVLQLLDALSTFLALQAGAYEANPLIRTLLEHAGWGAFIALKVAMAAMFLVIAAPAESLVGGARRFSLAALGGFAILMTAVVANNLAIAA